MKRRELREHIFELLFRIEFNSSEEMPEQIMAEKATEYILVEIEKEGLSGENVAAREVYGYEPEGDVWLESFSAREDGIVVKQETRVIWKT